MTFIMQNLGNNLSVRATLLNDGTLALNVKQVTASYVKAAADVAASLFGINLPILLIANGDSTYSLAVATPITPMPGADRVFSLDGSNMPMRLVALAAANTYALGTKLLTAGTQPSAGDQARSVLGVNIPMRYVSNADNSPQPSYALAIATALNPPGAGDQALSLFGSNAPNRAVFLSSGHYALGVALQ